MLKKNNLTELVGEHYNRGQIFYDLFWMNKKNLGMHYGFWETGTHNLHQAILNENKFIADQLKIEQQDIILDAGCGVGGTTIWLAENYGTKVIGITVAQKQIGLAKKYAKKRQVGHLVEFKFMNFCKTDFPNDFFTKILGIESVCHAENKEDFIKESFRILKPHGILVIADFFKRESLNEQEQYLLKQWCHGWEMPDFATLSEFLDKLETAGFKNVRYFDKTIEIEPSAKRMYFILGKAIHTVLWILEFIKIRSSHGGTQAALNQYFLFKKRAVTYNVFVAEKA